MERAKGIEPSYEAWEASVLPLNYARSIAKIPVRHGRRGGTRTPNPRFWRPVLYQLSYTPRAVSFCSIGAADARHGRFRLTSPLPAASFRAPPRPRGGWPQGLDAHLSQLRNGGRRHRRPSRRAARGRGEGRFARSRRGNRQARGPGRQGAGRSLRQPDALAEDPGRARPGPSALRRLRQGAHQPSSRPSPATAISARTKRSSAASEDSRANRSASSGRRRATTQRAGCSTISAWRGRKAIARRRG